MEMSTLSDSIFGSKGGKSKNHDDAFGLFNASNTLPEKPNYVNFTGPKRKQSHKSKRKLLEQDDEEPHISGDGPSGKKMRQHEQTSAGLSVALFDVKKNADLGPRATKQLSASSPDSQSNIKDITTEDSTDKVGAEAVDIGSQEIDKGAGVVDERTIFVGNLPLEITRNGLASIFKVCGKVLSARLRSFATAGVKVSKEMGSNSNFVKKIAVNTKSFLTDSPKKTAQGYVVFSDIEATQKALLMNNQSVSVPISSTSNVVTVKLRVDSAKPTIDASRSVFVGNLPYAADEYSLRQHFNTVCGWDDNDDTNPIIDAVRIIRDPLTMQCKGFGYVLFKDKIPIPDALRKAHQTSYMNRELRVVVCGRRLKSHNAKKEKGAEATQGRKFEGTRSTGTDLNAASRRIMKKLKIKQTDPTKVAVLALKKSFEKTRSRKLR